jgi:hypothetical protein
MSEIDSDGGLRRGLTPAQEERLADYLSGSLTPEARGRFEREILEDDALSAALYSEVNLETSLRASQGPAAGAPTATGAATARRRSWFGGAGRGITLRWALPVAGAAVVLIGFLLARGPLGGPESANPGDAVDPIFRGAEGKLRLVAPIGSTPASPERFIWTREEGAVLYRFELFDEEMRPLFQVATPETALAASTHGFPEVPRSGAWKVSALGPEGTALAESPITRYALPPP